MRFDPIEWDAVQPDPTRRWYAQCYGVRGTVWCVRGVFSRTYFILEDYMHEALREHLPATVFGLVCVIESELHAAIDAPMGEKQSERWNELFLRPFNPEAQGKGEG